MIDQVRFAAIKAQLSDVPGIADLSAANTGARLEFAMRGMVVATTADATDAQIESAIRIIFGGTQVTDITASTSPPPSATTSLPALTPVTAPPTVTASVTGATHAVSTIKSMIADAKSAVEGAHANLLANATRVKASAGRLQALGDGLGKEADDLDAMIGQYTNGGS